MEQTKLTGIELITKERQAQLKRWNKQHDALYTNEQLALFAMYYASPENIDYGPICLSPGVFFPKDFSYRWAKRDAKDRITQLATAGALIAAEIDRLQALSGK